MDISSDGGITILHEFAMLDVGVSSRLPKTELRCPRKDVPSRVTLSFWLRPFSAQEVASRTGCSAKFASLSSQNPAGSTPNLDTFVRHITTDMRRHECCLRDTFRRTPTIHVLAP